MIQSMTGYGKAVGEYEGRKFTVEIKSLNSKQLDLQTKIPALYKEKEMALRNALAQALERGKVEFSISLDSVGKDLAMRLNADVVAGYREQISQMSQALGMAEPADWWGTLLRIPDVYKSDAEALSDEEWAAVERTVTEAVEHFRAFRVQEGVALQRIFEQKIANIAQLLAEVEPYERERIEKIKAHLRDNLSSLTVDYDKNRFEQELIFYIEKLDINEEKVRLSNHLKYFAETMAQDASNGKKLGFIAQEMGREINTLGSKSNHSEMQIIVVRMKDELEQIKEQVLNVL